MYLANLGVPVGSKQGGVRPVLVLQNDVGNLYALTITIVPLTSKVEKKKRQLTHYFLRKAKGLQCPSTVLAEQLDKLITRKEAADLLEISVITLEAVRMEGLITYVQYVANGCIYFTETGIQEYIARCTHRAHSKEGNPTYRKPRASGSGNRIKIE